jgi:hypothetical protein
VEQLSFRGYEGPTEGGMLDHRMARCAIFAAGSLAAAGLASLEGCVGDSSNADLVHDEAGAAQGTDGSATNDGSVVADGAGSVMNDAGVDSSAASDAGADADAAACDPKKPFGALQAVNGFTGDHGDIWLGDDQLTAFVTQYDTGVYHIFTTSRSSPTAAFGASTLSELNSMSEDGQRATLSADGLVVAFHAYRGGGNFELYTSTRTSTAATFPTPGLMASVNSSGQDQDAMLTADALDLYFASNRNGGNQVFHATRATRGAAFGTPMLVDLGGDAKAPVLTRDGLTLFFSTTRGGAGGVIWQVKRSTTADGFGAPSVVAELDDHDDAAADGSEPNWVSPDGCTIYTTKGVSGVGSTVRFATRPK